MRVKAMNTMKKKEAPPAPPGPTKDQQLLMEIRDALRAKARHGLLDSYVVS